ncbi:hypothetical protein LA080_005598 [Diaporthe eres]|uniref:Alpha/beta hydrolase fold-3 domain-containing protein n=1 Tax=Diaporthe vaccinii TaxID=105482 RepID=A0ABR4F183_9PEZI|nr:hypothetical protein LA080_005598 [Diaporthe eres]
MRPSVPDTEDNSQTTVDLFASFNSYEETYKYVDGVPIQASILIPKPPSDGKRPLLVRLHGGAWTEGSGDIWIRPWIPELALKHNAILVSPDYRLRPEATFAEIVDDIRDFWVWVEDGLPGALSSASPPAELDLHNIALTGESAGGHLAAESALLGMTRNLLRIVIPMYPALDLTEALEFTKREIEYRPVSILEDYLANSQQKVLTRTRNGARMELACSMMQNGRLVDPTGPNAYLDPLQSLESAGAQPPYLVAHGKTDKSVPFSTAEKWTNKLRDLQPEVPLLFAVNEGDHIFDREYTLDTPWMREPIAFVEKYWPKDNKD